MADTVIITGEKTVTVVTVGVQGPAGISGSSIPATNTTLGGIIVGGNLSITGNGVLSVADTFQPKTSCVTYGLTDTLLPSGPNTFYVRGEHVVQSGRNFYSGLRGRKTPAGSYLSSPITYGIGGYNVDANGTPTGLSSIETSASVIILSSADSTDPISASTATLNSAGTLTLATSNGVTGGSCSVFLDDGTVTVSAGASGARIQLAGSDGTLGVGFNDFAFRVGSDSFSKGVSIKRQSLVTSVAFIYSISNATATFSFDSGLFFYDGDPLSAATELQHKYTNTFSNTTSSTKIRLVRNNAELSFAEMIQVKTTNSILTQGYADTRYQAVGAYLTSANLTYANLTGTPTTLAGYGITDGLTISSANSTYAVLGHTHSIANVTGLQTALDAKLESANFTYSNLTGKPSTFAPSAHTHSISEVTGLQTALDAKLPSANFTYANLTGKPTLANVATSGSYTDLSNTPTAYSLPTATNTTLGGIKVGANLSISNGVLSAISSGSSTTSLPWANITSTPTTLAGYGITDGLTASNLTAYLTSATAASTYLPIVNFTYANITGKPTLATVATTGSYTDLTNTPASYSLPTATTSVLGGVKVDGSSIVINSGIISSTYSYTLPAATTSTLGGVRLGAGVNLDANGFLISDVKLGTNTFTGSQNLQDNELIRAKLRDYSETVSSPTISSGTLTLNLETSNIFTVSLNAAITTLTISNPPASGSGGSFTLILTADGTARAVAWPASIKWAGGTAPTITSTSGKVDSFAFFTSDGGTTWQGYVGGQNF